MVLTFGPLFSLPFAALLLRRLGFRYDAWVLPVAIGLLWLATRGYGSEPLFVASTAAFVFVALLVERFVSDTRFERIVPAGTFRTTSGPRSANAAVPRSTRSADAPSTVDEAAPQNETLVQAAERTNVPLDGAELVARIDDAASEDQRNELLDALRATGEVVALLRARQSDGRAALGQARATASRPWREGRTKGLLVAFDGIAPAEATVLVVLCDVDDPEKRWTASERDGLRGSALLVPTDLPGVKRLGLVDGETAGWVARAVFIPHHLVIGGVRGDRGPGRGERVTGRPA
ncbi:MAG: hypothetical protein AAGA20_07770 [Planctomycetota bacterium]